MKEQEAVYQKREGEGNVMRKRFTRLMSWMLVAVLVFQESGLTVSASGLSDAVEVESETTAEQEESTTVDVETESSTEESTGGEGETPTETVAPETTETVTEESTEAVVEETVTEVAVEETEEVEEESVAVDAPATDSAYDDVTVIVEGSDIIPEKVFEKEDDTLKYWTMGNNNDAAIESIVPGDDAESVVIAFSGLDEGADWQTSLQLDAAYKLTAGKNYQVSYTITSTLDRTVLTGFDNGTRNNEHRDELKANVTQQVTYTLENVGEYSKFEFYLGNVDGVAREGSYTITISDLAIQEIDVKPTDGTAVEETDGNYVTYGTFAEGTYEKLDEAWDITKESATVKTSKYKVVFDITRDAAWYQNRLQQTITGLSASSKYKIQFDIESEIDRKMVFGFDTQVWYKPVELKAETPTSVEYVVTGTTGGNFAIALGSNLPDSSYTDVEGNQLTFSAEPQTLGAHRVTISNVRITEIPVELPDTENDEPYAKITNLANHKGYTAELMNPLKDGSFTNGLANWETYSVDWMERDDLTKFKAVEDGMSVWINNTGGDAKNVAWDVQLNQKISLAKNTEYVLSFKVHSEKARAINVTISDIDNGESWVKPIAIQKGETREVILNLPKLTEDATDKLFSIQMGNVAGDVLDNTLTFTDMKLEVNGYGELAERIADGGFDEGTAGSFTTAGEADTFTADFTDKYFIGKITKECKEEDASISSDSFSMLAGNNLGGNSYTVSFVAGATENRTMKAVLVGDNGSTLKEETIHLTTDAEEYSFTYTPSAEQAKAYVKLLVGGAEGTVCVDTIRCDITGYPEAMGIDTSANDIKLLEKKDTPAISEMPASDAVAGKDIVLTFKKAGAGEDYKAAVAGDDSIITINGTTVAKDKYTVADGTADDEYAITLAQSLFSVSDDRATFDIVIKAPWYQSVHIRQTVYKTKQWNATWLEEFNGTALDETKWSYQEGTGAEYGIDGWGNAEEQYYTRDNLKVADGELVITAQKERRDGKTYTSSRIWTMNDDQKTAKFSQTYGRMEAKMKMAGGEGYEGIWPAFWMLPVDTSIYGTWPLSGEIDILEARGREPDKADGTVHYGKAWPNNESSGGVFDFDESQYNSDSDINDYHVYAVEWEPGEIRWYVDDELYYTYNNWYSQSSDNPDKYVYPAPFDQDFYIVLNMAVGGSFDGNLTPSDDKLPVDMKVDYVRVYQSATGYEDVTEEPPVLKDETTDITTVKSELYDKNFENIKLNVESLVPDVWNLMTLEQFGGSASFDTVTQDETVLAKITPQNLGSAAHAIQLIQDLDMVKGYNYRISFDAKTEGTRKLNMKIGQDGTEGWNAYETFETTLTSELQHYVYEFQAGQTDLHSRVEFNLATSTAPVYIGNITYEIIDEITVDEDCKKTPSDSGNHVWNGSFNVGAIGGLSY